MNKHLLRYPHDQGKDQWWYEEPRGIVVVMFCNDGTSRVAKPITWSSLRAALKRKDAPLDKRHNNVV